jgi:hypothetical protein
MEKLLSLKTLSLVSTADVPNATAELIRHLWWETTEDASNVARPIKQALSTNNNDHEGVQRTPLKIPKTQQNPQGLSTTVLSFFVFKFLLKDKHSKIIDNL